MFKSFTGLEYLQMDIACQHDKAFEKENWEDRLAYFETLNLDDKSVSQATNPIGMRAALECFKDTKKNEAVGYMISLDATASGLQLLSMLISCSKSYELCGGNEENCIDSYTSIYHAMDVSQNITRKDTKQAIMTALYGSTAIPEMVFGKDIELFYRTMENMVPGAWNLNLSIQELWNSVPGSEYSWILPDNFHCHIETSDKIQLPFNFLGTKYVITKEIKSKPRFHKGLGPNLIHSIDGMVVREMFRRCCFDKRTVINAINALSGSGNFQGNEDKVETLWEHYRKTGFLSTRILRYLDKSNVSIVDPITVGQLIQTLPDEPIQMVSIHDAFKCHPNHGNIVRQQYNNIMADINDSNMLEDIASQIVLTPQKVNKAGSISRTKILNSNYMVC